MQYYHRYQSYRYIHFGKFISLLFLIHLLNLHTVYARSIRNLSIEQGLSNRRVLGSAYDEKGYIWFATKTNIDRYDGEKFDSYILSNNEKTRGIAANKQKRIYAFTERTVYVYEEKKDNFEQVVTLNNRTDNFSEASINSLYFDNRDKLIIGTNSGVLVNDDKGWYSLKELNNIAVHSIQALSANTYLFGTTRGVFKFRKNSSGKLSAESNKVFAAFAGQRIQSIYFDKNTNQLWIGTFSSGLYTLTPNSNAAAKLIYKTTVPIKTITEINGTEIWIGSDGDGVFIFDRFSTTFKQLLAQSDNIDDNIGANGIYHILEAEDKVWISTYTAGVFIVNTKSIVSRQYRHQKFNSNSLLDDHVNVVFEDSEGDLWFGTNKGLSYYNIRAKRWKQYFSENSGARENSVILSVAEDRNGEIWVGGYATILSKINKKSGKITEIRNLPGSGITGKSYIYAIYQDEDGFVWLGGSVDKLKQYNPSTGQFRNFDVEGVHKILNCNNELYLATFKGVFVLNKQTGEKHLLDMKNIQGGESLISYPFINNIIKDISDENVLWIGTEGFGLIRYDIRKKEIKIYSKNNGLTSNYIFGLLYDNSEKLWISTENGLNRFDTKSGNIVSYFEFDGLTNNSFNFLAYCRLKSGKLIFGTPSGANEILPDNIQEKQNPQFNLRMKGFYLFYEKASADSENSPLELSIDETKEITLTYTQHTFSIDFINLDIANQGRTLYSWKLDGFEKDWTQPSTEHKAIYTNLPTGRYTFMVKAIRIDTNNESEVRTIDIVKKPPFWASIYAYIFYLVFLGWFAYFGIKFWLNKVDTKFTQDKIKFFVSMAHEIRTPITLIKAPLNEIDNENLTPEGRSALELARKNTDKLFGLVSQLLDFQKIEADAMKLLVEETYLNVYVDNILNNFSYLAHSKDIEFKKLKELSSEVKVWIDRNKVQIMLENLITNAIKYTEKGGYIHVLVDVLDEKLIIQVSDNGIGIPANAQSNLFNTFYRAKNAASSIEIGTGIGLMFTKRLAELHRGTISFLSSENVGSTFRIEIPIEKSAYSESEIHVNELIDAENETVETDDMQTQMHILLVEDNDELRTYLSKMLRKKYSIVEAANGVEAIGLLEKENPDLILSDILMPEMNGFELCEKVKSNISTCHIPLILLTSLSDREDVVKGLSLGADDYITKPFDILILESKIKTIFSNRALFRKKYIEKSVSLNENNQLNDLNKTFMKKLVDLIENNITDEEFNIDEIASEMAMSRSVFFKKVKSLTGQNPKDFIRDIKMNKAADLLRDKKYTVSEIAYLIGFPNAKYFSTAFKKYYGISPTTFIEREKREENYLEN